MVTLLRKEQMSTVDSLRTGLKWTRAISSYLAWARGETARGSGRVQAGDINIFYKWFGYGEPLLLLHGGFTLIEGWVAQIPALSSSNLLIAMDSRGHGRTTLGTAGLTYRQMGRDAAALLDILHTGPVTVVGASDGGNAALGLAVQRPDLVKGLVLMGTSLNLENCIADKRATTEEFLSPWSPELISLSWIRGLSNPEKDSRNRFIDQMRKLWTEPSDVRLEDLSAVKAPTLIIAGDRDEFIAMPGDPLAVFQELRDAIPGARMTVITDGSHGLNIERAATVNCLIKDFISEPYGKVAPEIVPPPPPSRSIAARFASLVSTFARDINR